jgi:transcriptional antiterminator RfaH
MHSWYLVYTKPQRERAAFENLVRQGFETYLPQVRVRRRRAGRAVQRVEPMFPRYLFIHLSDVSDNWGPIRSTIGVANLVRFANRAARVPEDFVSMLREHEDEGGIQALETPAMDAGTRVRIQDGVFQGYEAVFQAKTSGSRVLLLLEVAGKLAKIQISEDHVGPL